ncbi:MAG TPA: hypothetical protein VGO30_03705 [Mycobacterium sp.]|nr:hypothetical protein [Mycobacterium sp.]
MNIVGGAVRVFTQTANAATAAAGALGGAAVNGVIGGVQGTASGVRSGLSSGSHSTPAAALTLGAIGAAGLIDWPLLLAIGGTALVVHQLSGRSDGQQAAGAATPLTSVDGGSSPRKSAGRGGPRNSAPRKSSTAARKRSPRKAGTARRHATT